MLCKKQWILLQFMVTPTYGALFAKESGYHHILGTKTKCHKVQGLNNMAYRPRNGGLCKENPELKTFYHPKSQPNPSQS